METAIYTKSHATEFIMDCILFALKLALFKVYIHTKNDGEIYKE